MIEIQFIQKGTKLDNSTKDYISEKLSKHEKLLEKATNLSVLVKFNKNYDPDKLYRMEISVAMPHTFIKVEERASTPTELVDVLEVNLKRKLTRYFEQFKKWEKSEPWKIKEIRKLEEEGYDASYIDYEPSVKKAKMETNRAMHIGEAVERLEMSGKNAYLFKNMETKQFSMLYRTPDQQYLLIEGDE